MPSRTFRRDIRCVHPDRHLSYTHNLSFIIYNFSSMQSFYVLLSAAFLLFSPKEDPSVSKALLSPKTPDSNVQTVDNHLFVCLPSNSSFIVHRSSLPEQPIVLKTLDEVPLDAPTDVQTYQTGLAAAKTRIEKWDDIQKQNARHWQINPILRWNEYARQLVAAYNVPPRCLPDSSGYPTPSRAHAADLPRYPFANPPYASRVFAYMSVAQYDALLAAQFYQAKFQKKDSNAASRQYPSTEATLAAASAEVLKYMFPAEINEIEEKAEKARQSAISTGKYAENDLEAAEKLGKAIAEKVIERAKADGMEAAQGQNQPIFSAYTEGGKIGWLSKQRPARPSIEPAFGTVKSWWLTDVAQMRPSPPPATNSDELKKELAYLKHLSLSQTKKGMDLAVRWADAEFTHTPIGHWNLIACDLFIKNKTNDVEIVRTLARLNQSLMDAAIVCWDAKMYYNYPRPSQLDVTIHPRLPLPNFPSYPSGHSVFSSTAATVLGHFFPNEAINLDKMAEEASESRVYAALHFKMDCVAGTEIGKKIGRLAIEKSK
jgi:PAP2 superfamily